MLWAKENPELIQVAIQIALLIIDRSDEMAALLFAGLEAIKDKGIDTTEAADLLEKLQAVLTGK